MNPSATFYVPIRPQHWGLALLLLLLSLPALALGPDLAGGQDHPLLSRFSGAQLVGYQQLEYERGHFYQASQEAGMDPQKELDRDHPLIREGKITRLLYIAPAGKTALEIQRNFAEALSAGGFNLITQVDGRGAWWTPSDHWRSNFAKLQLAAPFAEDISPFDREGLYLYATLQRNGVEVAVSVLSGPLSSFSKDHYQTAESDEQSAIAIQIVEPQLMASGQVQVSAEAIGQGLSNEGRIALYGIYFDSGNAQLKAESQPQLAEMANLLRQQPQLAVYIVGHTDNQGTLAYNLKLSQQRAEAVQAALQQDYGIPASQLSARGIANLAPVASNQSETGRALNRRVEMVVQ
ncbi:OmpA family protein [Balneatrix alpica]|uniref:OmpA family protein n=1 Tax=Balneatrix alpica TaxID=75684 RepID=UPI0027390133|nr:OmpA family protein [Balneatrix alpica]